MLPEWLFYIILFNFWGYIWFIQSADLQDRVDLVNPIISLKEN